MEWLLSWLPELRRGNWPPHPHGTGYVDLKVIRRSESKRAKLEVPGGIADEVDARLASCGLDRYLAEDFYTNGLDLQQLEQKLSLDIFSISRRLKACLSYISGWRRKEKPYSAFKRNIRRPRESSLQGR